jgi:shikimate dehydrogenase
MRRFGLIGYPLTSSFSKKYFAEKFRREGLKDCSYDLFPIIAIDELLPVIRDHPGLEGLNITIPYKQAIIPFLTDTSQLPKGLDACNCIKIVSDELIGYNTDVIGFERSFTHALQSHHNKALVLGNGGATAAIVHVLKKVGIDYDVVSRRNHSDSRFSYADLNKSIINEHTIIINTTPLGMYPNIDTSPEIPYEFLTDRHFLYDCVYNPEKTLFLQKGEKQGARIKNGLEMLIVQAEESWNIWTH